MLVIPVLRRLRQEGLQIGVTLNQMMRPWWTLSFKKCSQSSGHLWVTGEMVVNQSTKKQ